jgi:ribosomal RNA assembly protein
MVKMTDFANKQYINVPLARVAVIIGRGGETKRAIETATQTTLDINSVDGIVEIKSSTEGADPLSIYRAKAVCEAIGRGFSPERAFRLFNQEEMLKIIDLKDVVGKTKANLSRIKGRVIGDSGRARSMIEELTGSRLSIFDNTIAILGTLPQMRVAEEAVNMLIDGSYHKSVYQFLFKKRKELDISEEALKKYRPKQQPAAEGLKKTRKTKK